MNKYYGIFGIGGCGRGIMPLARDQLASAPGAHLVFVDDGGDGTPVNGHDVLTLEQFAAARANLVTNLQMPQA